VESYNPKGGEAMSDMLSSIERIVKEHEETLENIRDLDNVMLHLEFLSTHWAAVRSGVPVLKLVGLHLALENIRKDLEKHMHFEEDEFLPTLTKYASDIVSRGVLFEHNGIIKSINKLGEHARVLSEKSDDHEELLREESKIKEAIGNILDSLKEHVQTSEVIYKLAREALTQEPERKRQP